MSWSISLKLEPGEEIFDDSSKHPSSTIKPAYSVFLTNRRAVFRFDSLGSSLSQSFNYEDIKEARPTKRLLIDYLFISTSGKDFYLNTSNAGYWAEQINVMRKKLDADAPADAPDGSQADEAAGQEERPLRTPGELKVMLGALREHGLLSDGEYEDILRRLSDKPPGG